MRCWSTRAWITPVASSALWQHSGLLRPLVLEHPAGRRLRYNLHVIRAEVSLLQNAGGDHSKWNSSCLQQVLRLCPLGTLFVSIWVYPTMCSLLGWGLNLGSYDKQVGHSVWAIKVILENWNSNNRAITRQWLHFVKYVDLRKSQLFLLC